MTVNLIKGSKGIRLLISKIAKNATALKSDIHSACVSACLHHLEHGDVEPINQLIEASKDCVHNNAVHRWFEKFGCVSWSSKDKKFVHSKDKIEKAKANEEYVEEVMTSKTYYELTPTPSFSPVKLLGVVASAIKRYEAMSDEEKADKRNDVRGMDELKALLAKAA